MLANKFPNFTPKIFITVNKTIVMMAMSSWALSDNGKNEPRYDVKTKLNAANEPVLITSSIDHPKRNAGKPPYASFRKT